ncbi:hypothetical protein SAMN02745119_01346 [Trichlorobacter thiogenes]|uniref:Lipoprotein n=1 Tax=Trichlorobacter thiogenes TaxID=115783 RepID=A0A1T4MKH1_9BACT|nr:hypothetical protein [Trichlorobacter thiogenes]SJZ67492.1 hypothetical protein SAMN02745119_01346 [Trichlorobacter thiogenes]
MKLIPLVFLLLLMAGCAHKPLHEKDYQRWWCEKHAGELEYRLPDKTRVDCLTKEYAVEVEYASKWAESIGQALYYGQSTGRKPAVLVIVRDKDDERFLKRLRTVAKEQGIKVWTVRPKDLE